MAREVDALVEFTKVVTSDFQFQVDMSIPRQYFKEEVSIYRLSTMYSLNIVYSTAVALQRFRGCIHVMPNM